MAARLVDRLRLTPPIDVETLCRNFADVADKYFPVEIDGLCLDLKVSGKRPKVWVSKNIPPVRRRFTIAHEIGHIIIPWHRGTIIDDIDAPRSHERSKYRETEAEANRFAAELLMPSAWAVGLAERSDHAGGLMHSIHEIADVSFPAAFLKAMKFGRPGFLGAEVRDGAVVRSGRTPGTESFAPKVGDIFDNLEMPAAYDPRIIYGPESQYYWWEIRQLLDVPVSDLLPWRRILEEMLTEIPAEFRLKARASLDAITGSAMGKEPKGGDVRRIYRRGIEAAQNRSNDSRWVSYLISHPQYKNYVLARAKERASQH